MSAADAARTVLCALTAMAVTWVCDFRGYEGAAPDKAETDQVQCPVCGEPVTPLR